MAYDGGNGRGSNVPKIALILIGLLVAAMLVSIVLRILKVLVYAALLLVGAMVVMRAVRRRP